MRARRRDGVRFWRMFVPSPSGCWLWTDVLDPSGYGKFHIKIHGKYRRVRAHRWAYEYLRGPIPDGLQIDHLCRVRCCVNPRHMEPVSGRVNTLRGNGPSAANTRKTHCIWGHSFADHGALRPSGGWVCRICRDERKRGYRRAARARAKKLSAKRRSEIAQHASQVRWGYERARAAALLAGAAPEETQ